MAGRRGRRLKEGARGGKCGAGPGRCGAPRTNATPGLPALRCAIRRLRDPLAANRSHPPWLGTRLRHCKRWRSGLGAWRLAWAAAPLVAGCEARSEWLCLDASDGAGLLLARARLARARWLRHRGKLFEVVMLFQVPVVGLKGGAGGAAVVASPCLVSTAPLSVAAGQALSRQIPTRASSR